MPSPVRRLLISLAVIAVIIFALAAAYAIADQDTKKRANTMEASLSLYCTQDLDVEVTRCNEWVERTIRDWPDVVKACDLGERFTYDTKAECVRRNPFVSTP